MSLVPRFNFRLIAGLINAGLGRKAGFAQFGGTPDAFLASLAPWVAFLLVLCGLAALSGYPVLAIAAFLIMMCNLLAPAVIADLLCRLWGRRANWARFANVLNCAPWLVLAAFVLLMPVASVAVSAGVPIPHATAALVAAVLTYGMWFAWFAARHVLDLSAGRALVLTLAIVIGTSVLSQLPVTVSDMAGFEPSLAKLQHFSDQVTAPPQTKPATGVAIKHTP